MKVLRKMKRKAEIPNASMSDIAFLLIIFFMSTTKFDLQEGVKVMLNPYSTTEEIKSEIKVTPEFMTRIDIIKGGFISINNEAPRLFSDIEMDKLIQDKIKLRNTLNKQSGDPNEKDLKMLFVLKTASDASYNDMVRVVDLLVTYRDKATISISTKI